MRVRGQFGENRPKARHIEKSTRLTPKFYAPLGGESPVGNVGKRSEKEALDEACRRDEPPEDDRRKNQIQPDAHERAKHSTFLSMMGATEKLVRP